MRLHGWWKHLTQIITQWGLTTGAYHWEEVDDELRISSENEERSATEVLVGLEWIAPLSSHDVDKVWRQHKWRPLSLETLHSEQQRLLNRCCLFAVHWCKIWHRQVWPTVQNHAGRYPGALWHHMLIQNDWSHSQLVSSMGMWLKELWSYHAVFDVPQEVTKVNVEEVSWGSHHDVVVMTITNALKEEE